MKYTMSLLTNFIEEYEETLTGERTEYSIYFFEDRQNAERIALECIRYACEKMLHWSPRQTCRNLNHTVARIMKLDSVIVYINFPFELEKNKDMDYVLHLMYPDIVPFSMEDTVINMYKQILNGKVQFPREYATGHEGVAKLCICLHYAIETYHPFHSIKEMYHFFSSTDGVRFMKKYNLHNLMTMLGFDPLTLIHEMLPDEQKNEFYLNYYRFWKCYKRHYRLQYSIKNKTEN